MSLILQERCWVVPIPFVRIIFIYSLRFFHISVSWWYFTGIRVRASLINLQNSSRYSGRSPQWCSLDVSTRPPTSKSSSPFNNHLVSVRNAPITIGIILTFMFHSFFQFPNKVEVLILLFSFFKFYSVVNRNSKVHNFASSLFLLLITIRSGLKF